MTVLAAPIELTATFPATKKVWTDPVTGFTVPKELLPNLKWRAKLLREAENDPDFRDALWAASAKSVLFWANTFVWTLRKHVVDENGQMRQCTAQETHMPYITWDIQDKHILKIEDAIVTGYDILTDKSRDMGATWNHLIPIYHQWLFHEDRNFLLLSRKETCVDSAGKKGLYNPADPGTLFGKLDYISMWLPEWMRPPYDRSKMHLVNPLTNSRIDGESANASAGSSDRRTAVLLDEMAKMSEGEAIKRSTRDVTACRLANSTPNGPGTAFSNWRLSNQIEVFVLPWWEHPEKGRGRYIEHDESTGKDRILSPWYLKEAESRTPKEMAIEIDMDHFGSGENYFEISLLDKYIKAYASPPTKQNFHITFKGGIATRDFPRIICRRQLDQIEARHDPHGAWKFWTQLVDGRPDQSYNYVFGIDIGKGMGASNSVISVGCIETREKVAEWASATVPPANFAYLTAAAALWWGGAQRGQRPLVIWEANGDPGIYFGKVLVKELQYPACYLDRHAPSNIRMKRARKYGWHSSTEKKGELLSAYRRAIAHATIFNHSQDALAEAATYVYLPGGEIGPASLVEESASARKTHGDRVIADALMTLGFEISRVQTGRRKDSTDGHLHTIERRFQEWRKKRNAQTYGRRFDFSRNAG